jgi:hypothetical protein
MDDELIILTDDDFEPDKGQKWGESLNQATGNRPTLA